MIPVKDFGVVWGIASAAVLAGCLLGACDDNGIGPDRHEYEEQETRTIDLVEQTELVLEALNGLVDIEGSTIPNLISLGITRRVESDSYEDAQAHIDDIVVTDETGSDYVHVWVEHPTSSVRNYEVDFEIGLPADFDVEVDAGNGKISVSSVVGKVELGIGNGVIDLEDVTTRHLELTAGNGSVGADVTLPDTCAVNIAVGNGGVALEIPRETNAWFDVSVGNGEIRYTALPFEELQSSPEHLVGRLGDGSGQVVIAVGNGTVLLEGK